LTGSLSFALQGVSVEPRDIDLQTDETGAYAIEKLFQEQVVKPVAFWASENMRSHFGVLEIAGIKVEIMGRTEKAALWQAWLTLQSREQQDRGNTPT
jgi:hypothetical protein